MTAIEFTACLNFDSSRRFTLVDGLRLAHAAADLTEADRRKLSKAAVDKYRQPLQSLHYSSGYREYLELAVLAVGPLSAAKKLRCDPQFEPAALKILSDRKPDWADAWLEAAFAGEFTWISWWLFRELLRAEICSRPTSENFLRFFVRSVGSYFGRAIHEHIPRSEHLRQAPEFIDDVWRCFEVETDLFNTLINNPIHRTNDQHEDWADTMLRLSESGHMDRRRLLTATLRALGSDFSSQSLTGLIRLYDRLSPTPAEVNSLQPAFVTLLSSRVTHVAKFALEQFAVLHKAGELDATPFLAAAPQVFALKPKGQPLQVLTLAVKLARDRPELVPEVANLASEALTHEAADVQTAAVKWLEANQARLHRDHASELQARLDGLSATLRPRVAALIAALGGSQAAPEEVPAETTSLDEWRARAAAIPANWRGLAGVNDALSCLETDSLFLGIWFDVLYVPVLSSCAPIAPIGTVDELLDAAAHALEHIDSAGELERILDGISRLCDQRTADFELRSQPLMKRLRSERDSGLGIMGFQQSPKLSQLLLRWLGATGQAQQSRHEDPRSLTKFVERRLREIEARLVAGRPQPLICAPTHEHGWLDPRVFVERLQLFRETSPPPADLIQALLRLAPEHRAEALENAAELPGEWGAAVRYALDGPEPTTEIVGEDAFSLWLAAGRARQVRWPLNELQAAAGPQRAELLVEATFSWKVIDEDTSSRWIAGMKTMVDLNFEPQLPRAEATSLRPTLAIREENLNRWQMVGPVWCHMWMSALWPANPDHLLADAIYQLRWRVNSPASSFEPNHLYFQSLLQPDLAWNELTWLALWMALVSKDAGSRGIALDLLIAGIEDGRAEMKCDVLLKCAPVNWFKLNRVADALREVARVSPRHAWWCADLLQRFVALLPEWPADIHHILAVLLELLAQLGLEVREQCRELIAAHTAKGKGAKLQKQILQLQTTHSHERQRALELALKACLARAQRWAEGSSTGK